jgi:DNA-binding LytR/AlgR family response regulator
MSSTTLKKIYDKIADYGFVRVHKSYVVNISRINGFNGTTLYVGAELIPIGRAYRADLMNRMTIL